MRLFPVEVDLRAGPFVNPENFIVQRTFSGAVVALSQVNHELYQETRYYRLRCDVVARVHEYTNLRQLNVSIGDHFYLNIVDLEITLALDCRFPSTSPGVSVEEMYEYFRKSLGLTPQQLRHLARLRRLTLTTNVAHAVQEGDDVLETIPFWTAQNALERICNEIVAEHPVLGHVEQVRSERLPTLVTWVLTPGA